LSALEDFQAQHGRDWAQLIGTPAFASALALSNSEKIQEIVVLTDDEIATKGQIILADLRGHLKYESGLLGLHEKKEFVFQQLGAEEYPDPAREARDEALAEAQERSGVSRGEAALSVSAHETLFPQPKNKPRGRPPKKGKKK
jgi:hypothetical protein